MRAHLRLFLSADAALARTSFILPMHSTEARSCAEPFAFQPRQSNEGFPLTGRISSEREPHSTTSSCG